MQKTEIQNQRDKKEPVLLFVVPALFTLLLFCNTTLQLMQIKALLSDLLFQCFHKYTGFYIGFDVLQQTGIKYLLTDLFTDYKTPVHFHCGMQKRLPPNKEVSSLHNKQY